MKEDTMPDKTLVVVAFRTDRTDIKRRLETILTDRVALGGQEGDE